MSSNSERCVAHRDLFIELIRLRYTHVSRAMKGQLGSRSFEVPISFFCGHHVYVLIPKLCHSIELSTNISIAERTHTSMSSRSSRIKFNPNSITSRNFQITLKCYCVMGLGCDRTSFSAAERVNISLAYV